MSEQHTDNLSPLQGEALRSYISDSYRELAKEPVLYQWKINHQYHFAWPAAIVVFVFFSSLWVGWGHDSHTFFKVDIWILVMLFIMCLGGRFLFSPNQLYHYHITSKGIFYTQQDNIPDMAFTIARGLGWFGCGVCVLAAGMLGPAAFIGAGASALLAWKIKDMRPVKKHRGCLFTPNGYLKIFKKKDALIVCSEPFDASNFIYIYCLQGESDKVLKYIYPYLPNHEVREVNSWREF